MKRIECLLKIAGIKFKFLKLRNPFSQTSGLVVKTVKRKRGISFSTSCHHGRRQRGAGEPWPPWIFKHGTNISLAISNMVFF